MTQIAEQTVKSCAEDVEVEFLLQMQSCVDGECSSHGKCQNNELSGDMISVSSCLCHADYKGYGCTDNRTAQSVAEQLAGAYLLTLSNIWFMPAIVVGLMRGYYAEAFVYTFTMFFSTFYHACDGIRLYKYRLCITDYDTLQLADFFGSACSLWFTLVAMARFKQWIIVGLLQVVGSFVILVTVIYDRTSLCVIAFPFGGGFVAILFSWGRRMYFSKKLYPSVRRYLFYLLPGALMAVIGGSSFVFFETRHNYKYVHSVWHTCVALCIVLLLPPQQIGRKKKELIETSPPVEVTSANGIPESHNVTSQT